MARRNKHDAQVDPFTAGEPTLPWNESPSPFGENDQAVEACAFGDEPYDGPTKEPDNYNAPAADEEQEPVTSIDPMYLRELFSLSKNGEQDGAARRRSAGGIGRVPTRPADPPPTPATQLPLALRAPQLSLATRPPRRHLVARHPLALRHMPSPRVPPAPRIPLAPRLLPVLHAGRTPNGAQSRTAATMAPARRACPVTPPYEPSSS